MDSKQFDELVARLASGATRRNAVKGVLGGALAWVGVTSVAAAKGGKGKGKAKGKGKGKGKKYGHAKVTICHKGQTISVPEPALPAHMKHDDTMGPCYGDPEP